MRRAVALVLWLILAGNPAAAETPVSVQMHIHGSLSEGSGTMWAHTIRAEEHNLDVIWWTDHDYRITYWRMDSAGRFGWENGLEEPNPDLKGKLRWRPHDEELANRVAEVTNETAYAGNRSFRLGGKAPSGSGWKVHSYRYDAEGLLHRRSLLSDVWVKLAIKPPPDLYANARVVVALQLRMSKNLEGETTTITWLAGIPTPGSSTWESWRPLPTLVPGEWNSIEIPVSQQSIEDFPFGDDQSFGQFIVAVAARDGAEVEAHFDDFEIQVRGFRGQPLMERQREVLNDRHSQNLKHLVGTEITRAGHHLNAFGSNVPLIDYDDESFFDNYPWRAVQHVHDHGGVVAFNHIFGAGEQPGITPQEREELIARVTAEVVGARLYGCDVLEVGYWQRRLPIEDHLEVWDALSAAKVYVTGNGTSDDHHATRWQDLRNRMVTWLWVEEQTEAQMLDALREGRAFFGDPVLVAEDVTMDLATEEGHRMGDVVVTNRTSMRVSGTIHGLPAGYEIRAILNGSKVGTWISTGDDFSGSGVIPITDGAFIRLEAWSPEERPVLFSNPIYFTRTAPSSGGPRIRWSGKPVLNEAAQDLELSGESSP